MSNPVEPPDPEIVDALADEITQLLKQRSLAGMAKTPTHRLNLLAGVTSDSAVADRCVAIDHLLEITARSVEDEETQAAAIALVEGLGEFRAAKDRGRAAGAALGVTYHAFRRRDSSGVSHRDRVFRAIAEQLAANIPPSPASAARWIRAGVVVTVASAVVVGLAFTVFTLNRVDESVASPSATFVASVTTVAPESTTTSSPTVALIVGPDVFEGDPVIGDPDAPCAREVGELDDSAGPDADQTSADFAATYLHAGGRDAVGCPVATMNYAGGIYWQPFTRQGNFNGGLLGGNGHSVQVLNAGQWNSYEQIGNILGGVDAAPVRAGVPRSAAGLTADGWVLPLEPEGELIAEAEDGHYVWVSSAVTRIWNQSGRSGGEFGLPMTDYDFGVDGLRQDFTNGYVTVSSGGAVDWHPVDDPVAGLPADDDVKGRILESPDGTSWLIDDDLQRWWISDSRTWSCVGGDQNVAARGVAGYSMATYHYAGVVGCPSSESGLFPRTGGIDVGSFCASTVSTVSEAVLTDAGVWGCGDGKRLQLLDLSTVCQWQYGRSSRAVNEESDPSTWRCTS